MRLIIKEYLSYLKEKDELDFLLCDLLTQKGYITDNEPKSGVRQFGVDIQAHNQIETLLVVVKQGNITKNNFDSGPNAVRQSINEIVDAYSLFMSDEDKENVVIIVATNGVMDENINKNWSGFVNNFTQHSFKKLKIEFWNIDKITDEIQNHLLNEHLFASEMQSRLRKALYFLDCADYSNKMHEIIIDNCIGKLNSSNDKSYKKLISELYLLTQMICYYAANIKRYKICINISEYLILKYWAYLLSNNLFEQKKYITPLINFMKSYEKWNELYFDTIKDICVSEYALTIYNSTEHRVVLYEIIGYLTSYGFYLAQKDNKNRSQKIIDALIPLININLLQFINPVFDNDISKIIMLFKYMKYFNRTDEIKILLDELVSESILRFRNLKKYPAPSDTFEEAINIEMSLTEKMEPYRTSGFWGNILLLISTSSDNQLFDSIIDFLNEDISKVTKCVWYFSKEEEIEYYDEYAMYKMGTGVALSTNSFEKLQIEVEALHEFYEKNKFSFDEYCFTELEFMICRYFGYIPRVDKT